MTTWRLMDGLAGRPGSGPAAVTAYAGNFLAGTAFSVTQWGMWFQGYYVWVPSNGDTTARRFCLWQVTNNLAGAVIAGSTVTSGTLTQGAWNFVPLAAPVPLSSQVPYLAEMGYVASAGFPETKTQFGTAGTYIGGISNGPLNGYSDTAAAGGTNPVPNNWMTQGSFGTAGSDPAAQICNLGSDSSSNFWIDLQVADTAPAGYAGPYRLWPSMPVPAGTNTDQALNFTLGTQFSLSQACTVNRIWFYSGPGLTQLPTETAIYGIGSQAIIPGTDNTSPAWSGAAGSGWVSAAAGYVLPAGNYKAAVFNGAVTPAAWNNNTALYWSTGPGGGGITAGPLSAPDDAHAAAPGQASYHQGTPVHWPDTHSGPYSYWVDLDVSPVPQAAASSIIPQLIAMGVL